jgi:signal transduction histidine kinase/ligand-binding sensor domain-containing protein
MLGLTFRRWLCFGLLLISTLPVFGADGEWFNRVWQSDDGLPDNNVTGVAQTADGYLWVATTGGLARFDGVRLRSFSPSQLSSTLDRVVRAMILDDRGQLWMAMDHGPVACVASRNTRVFTGSDLPDLLPTGMVEDGEEAIWIAYRQGDLARIKDGVVARFGISQGLPNGGPVWLATDAAGRLWFSRDGNLGVFSQGRFKVLLTLPEHVVQIAASREGGIWIVSSLRILRLKEGHAIEERVRLPQISPTVLSEDREGALWIGTTDQGLFRYDHSTIESMPLSNKTVSYLAEDREGNMWVGTSGGGLNRLRRRTVELLGAGTKLPFESVRSVTEDNTGAPWVVTRSGLVAYREGMHWKTISKSANWPADDAMTVASDPSGGVWIGTHGHGLLRLQKGHSQQWRFKLWRKENGLVSDTVRSLLVSSTGDLWVGTDSPYALQRLRNGQWRSFDIPQSARYVRAMAEDANGEIWVGTSGGRLYRVSGDSLTDETTRVQSREQSIRCLHTSADGSLWIGYAATGMGRWKAGKFTLVSTAEGLWDDSISQIMADGENWLWVGSNHGIFRVDRREIEAVAEGRLARVHSVAYGRGEGLPSLQGSFDGVPEVFHGRNRHIWMATRAGLAVVHTGNTMDHSAPPPVILEQLTVDEKPAALYDSGSPLLQTRLRSLPDTRDGLLLPPGYRKIELQFTALSFSAPENVHFRYRLEGLEDDWIEAGAQRSVSYARLNPGNYRFHVTACNDAGVWNEAGTVLNLRVAPFFWQTWWFRAAVLAALTLLIAAVVRYFSFRRLRLKLQAVTQEATLNKERARIAQDLHDDLGARLTQATLLLELAQQDRKEMNGHVQEGLSTVRQAIQSLDETVWAVNPRNNTLAELMDYIGQFATEFLRDANIECHLSLPDHPPNWPLASELRHNLFLTVKEALNNVVRHARASEVWLQISVNETCLTLMIKDNGCGFEQLPEGALADGLRNMRQRAEEIGGQFKIESKLRAGTLVSVIYLWPSKMNETGIAPRPFRRLD